MPKRPRLTSKEAERLLLNADYHRIKSKSGHRIYEKNGERFILPFHSGKILHPKIIKKLFDQLAEQ